MSGELTRKVPGTHRRRHSTLGTGSTCNNSPSIANVKPIPNYLKPPVYSCHDMCKYGHKHSSESNWRPPVRPKLGGNNGIRGVVLNPELRVSGKKERLKREEVINGNISPPKEDIFVDKVATFVENAIFGTQRDRIEIEMPEEKVYELSDASSVREIKISDESLNVNSSTLPIQVVTDPFAEVSPANSLSMKVAVSNSVGMQTFQGDVTTEIPPKDESVNSDGEPSVNSSPLLTRSVSAPLAEELSEDSLSMKVVVPYSDGMHTPDVPVAEISSKDVPVKMVKMAKNAKATRNNSLNFRNGKIGEIAIKNIEREKVDKVSLKPTRNKDNVPKYGTVKTTDAPIQSRPRVEKAMSPINKHKLSNNSTTRLIKGEGEAEVLRSFKQSALVKTPTKSPRKLKKYKRPTSPHANNQDRIGGSISNAENAKEKTIYMIEGRQEIALGRNQVKKGKKGNQKGKTSSASSGSFTEKDRTINKKVVSHNKLSVSPHKMAFRRGKVIDVQAETNAPTRIKFRRVKPDNVINRGEGSTGVNKLPRKKRGGRSNGITGSTPPSGTPTVVLRHQDAPHDKNGAEISLFNHVIEETASKLAETRKSKVKALVGAFETVISLQEKSTVSSPS